MFKSSILPRLLQWVIVIFIGVTVAFVGPRFTPTDPAQSTLNNVAAIGKINPEAILKLEEVLKDLYGLRGNLLTPYRNFWKYLLQGDLGLSLSIFPTPVTQVIRVSLPWTAGLLLVSTLLGWFLSNIFQVVLKTHFAFLMPYMMADFICGFLWAIAMESTLPFSGLSALTTPQIRRCYPFETEEYARKGCKFVGRCPHVMDICKTSAPEDIFVDHRAVKCYLYQE